MYAARLKRIAPYVVVLLGAVALLAVAGRIDASLAGGGRLGPSFWPRLVLTLAVIVCLIEIGFRWAAPMARDDGGVIGALAAAEDEAAGEPSLARLGIGIVATLAYVALLGTLGFAIATALYLIALMRVGGFRRPVALGAIGILGTLALMLIFVKLVYVSLPLGAGPFRAASIALLAALGVR